MAVKFLDNTGLGYFWSKIKAWCNATFAAITHNHASNAVNAMTSYSKASSSSAISTNDSLNAAIGKLEYKVDSYDDSNYVHKTNDEIIQGIKTFSNVHSYTSENKAVLASIELKHPDLERNVNPITYSRFAGLVILDKNATSDLDYINRLAALEFGKNTDGTSYSYIKTYNPNTTDRETASLVVGWDNGIAYSKAPSTSSNRSDGNDIVTRDWIPNDTRIVHTTGDETIAGTKTLTANLYINKTEPGICFISSGIARNTAPSSNYDKLEILSKDKNDKSTWGLYHQYHTDKSNSIKLLCYKGTTTDTSYSGLGIGYDGNGNVYTVAPTPATSDNSTKIATTAFVKAQGYLTSHQSLSSCVKTSGDQTVGGIKTFTSDIVFKKTDPNIFIRNDSYTISSTAPSANRFWWIEPRASDNSWLGSRSWMVSTQNNASAYTSVKGFNTDDTVQVEVWYASGGGKFFRPGSNGDVYLGGTYYRWKQLYATTTTIATSDKRLKSFIENVPDSILDMWDKIEWKQFKMNDAISEKGENARLHTGLIAQDIDTIFTKNSLDISKYGLFCYDEWDYQPEIKDPDNNIVSKELQADYTYSIRYEEALCMEAAYQRRKNKILENRISELEKQVSDMLILLQNLTNGNG